MSGHIKDMVSQHWNTPQHIVDAITHCLYRPDLDPCDNEFSITNPRVSWKLPEHDGLKESWADVSKALGRRISVFCNPPFGRSADGTSIATWVAKAEMEQRAIDKIFSTILLVPSSTETTFWHEYIWGSANAVAFLKGRVAFTLAGKKTGASTKGTALVYWGDDTERFYETFDNELGKVVIL